ncbi:MAG: fused signal recognition particle receptor [Verrucomicrobiales bacterium]|jgi:fused signal recognition particle receptor
MAGLFSKILTRFRKDDIEWDDLEEALITGDLGVHLSTKIIDDLQSRGRSVKAEDVVQACRNEILKLLPVENPPLNRPAEGPSIILVVGVNGVGKTTSTAKLGKWMKQQGHSVMFAAADTFRAAAIEQLEVWSQRLDIPMVKGAYKADPSSVCYAAYQSARKKGVDFLLCDTAGRLHNRHNLMQELGKMERVLTKLEDDAPHEVLIVVDATTGSNALAQAKEFQAALTKMTGLIVTKLDGSGKGGVVAAIQDQLGVTPRFIGTGETEDDFESFDSQRFVEQIL